jgi:cytochrome P450
MTHMNPSTTAVADDGRRTAVACPYAAGKALDPADLGPAASPGWLERARRDTPIFWMSEINAWVVSRYEDVRRIAVDHRTFSSKDMNRLKPMTTELLADAFPKGHPGERSMLKMDSPDHTRVRRLADVGFSRQGAERSTEAIRRLVDDLIDTFVDDGRVEFVSSFAEKLPLYVILHITGIPLELEHDFTEWGLDMFDLFETQPPLSPEREAEIAARGKRIQAWMRELIERRRAEPVDDLVSHLLRATTPEGDPNLSDDEIIGVINSNLTAGVHTTAAHLPLMVYSLLSNRDQWDAVMEDRSLIPLAVEESLRFWSVARVALRRATCDVEVAGVTIRAGENVLLPWISADHDDTVMADPYTFDLRRPALKKHLAFGRGPHLCIGAQVARKELQVVLEQITGRLPNLRIAAAEGLGGPHLLTIPRLSSLELVWDRPGDA